MRARSSSSTRSSPWKGCGSSGSATAKKKRETGGVSARLPRGQCFRPPRPLRRGGAGARRVLGRPRSRSVVALAGSAAPEQVRILTRVPRAALGAGLGDPATQHVADQESHRQFPETPCVDRVVHERRDEEPEPREQREQELTRQEERLRLDRIRRPYSAVASHGHPPAVSAARTLHVRRAAALAASVVITTSCRHRSPFFRLLSSAKSPASRG